MSAKKPPVKTPRKLSSADLGRGAYCYIFVTVPSKCPLCLGNVAPCVPHECRVER